ncbi:MAG: hypothetical protein N2A99_06270 [Carnobacterium alterfunditum]
MERITRTNRKREERKEREEGRKATGLAIWGIIIDLGSFLVAVIALYVSLT